MLVLGIDPGTAKTGYALVRETPRGDLELVEYGVILTPVGLEQEKRLVQLYDRLREIILLHHPDVGAVEKLFFRRNVTTAISVGQARGVILLSMAQSFMPVAEYTPMEVKQAVSGYGGADKKQVQVMVQAILQMDVLPKPDDAADAIAIAITHLHTYKWSGQG